MVSTTSDSSKAANKTSLRFAARKAHAFFLLSPVQCCDGKLQRRIQCAVSEGQPWNLLGLGSGQSKYVPTVTGEIFLENSESGGEFTLGRSISRNDRKPHNTDRSDHWTQWEFLEWSNRNQIWEPIFKQTKNLVWQPSDLDTAEKRAAKLCRLDFDKRLAKFRSAWGLLLSNYYVRRWRKNPAKFWRKGDEEQQMRDIFEGTGSNTDCRKGSHVIIQRYHGQAVKLVRGFLRRRSKQFCFPCNSFASGP